MANTTDVQSRAALLALVIGHRDGAPPDPISQMRAIEHPGNFLFLLQLASREPSAVGEMAALVNETAESLGPAVVSYIGLVCLQQEHDPWLTLGLHQGAQATEVNRHYRLMIRLFHPDRGNVPADLAQAYSASINSAHARLSVEALNPATYQLDPPPMFQARQLQPEVPRFTSRTLITVAVALLVVLLVGLYVEVNLDRNPVLVSVDDSAEIASQEEIPQLSQEKQSLVKQEQLRQGPRSAGQFRREKVRQVPATKALLAKQKAQAKLDSAEVELASPERQSREGEFVMQEHLRQDQLNLGLERQEQLRQEPAQPVKAQEPAAPLSSSPTSVAPAQQVAPSGLTQVQLRGVVLQFLDSYNQGNLERMMALMGDDLKMTGAGKKDDLRVTYGMIFAQTDRREMILRDLRWDIMGTKASGIMSYSTRILNRGSSSLTSLDGTLRLEVALFNQRPLIVGLFSMEGRE